MKKCELAGCENKYAAKGYCFKHYHRQKKHGDPAFTLRPELDMSMEERFYSKIDKSGECWIWSAGKLWDGYGQFLANGRKYRAHRFMWELVNGPIPDGMYVCHNCPGGDNSACVNPDHLWLGTHVDNMKDAVTKDCFTGRVGLVGEQSPGAKVTEKIVQKIRQIYSQSNKSKAIRIVLAQRFGLSESGLQGIIYKKSWKHI